MAREAVCGSIGNKLMMTMFSVMSVEWAFYISGNIVTNERSCLKPSNVDMLVFLNKNLS